MPHHRGGTLAAESGAKPSGARRGECVAAILAPVSQRCGFALAVVGRFAERPYPIIDPAIAGATSPRAKLARVVVVIHFERPSRLVAILAPAVRRARRAFALGRRLRVV
jgi:hypothetical protein